MPQPWMTCPTTTRSSRRSRTRNPGVQLAGTMTDGWATSGSRSIDPHAKVRGPSPPPLPGDLIWVPPWPATPAPPARLRLVGSRACSAWTRQAGRLLQRPGQIWVAHPLPPAGAGPLSTPGSDCGFQLRCSQSYTRLTGRPPSAEKETFNTPTPEGSRVRGTPGGQGLVGRGCSVLAGKLVVGRRPAAARRHASPRPMPGAPPRCRRSTATPALCRAAWSAAERRASPLLAWGPAAARCWPCWAARRPPPASCPPARRPSSRSTSPYST